MLDEQAVVDEAAPHSWIDHSGLFAHSVASILSAILPSVLPLFVGDHPPKVFGSVCKCLSPRFTDQPSAFESRFAWAVTVSFWTLRLAA